MDNGSASKCLLSMDTRTKHLPFEWILPCGWQTGWQKMSTWSIWLHLGPSESICVGKNNSNLNWASGAKDKVIITCHIICSFVHSPLFIPSHLSSMRTVIIIGAPDGPRVFCRGLSRLGQQDQINLTGVDSNYTYMGIGKTYGPKLILSTPGKTSSSRNHSLDFLLTTVLISGHQSNEWCLVSADSNYTWEDIQLLSFKSELTFSQAPQCQCLVLQG